MPATPIDGERTVRRVRWLLAAVLVVYGFVSEVSETTTVLIPGAVGGVAVATTLSAINIVSARLAKQVTTEVAARRVGWATLFADTLAVLGGVAVFAPDPLSPVWALLALPLLEGAFRAQLRGAVAAWVVAAVVETTTRVMVGGGAGPLSRPDVLVARLGLLLVVAVVAGVAARQLRTLLRSLRAERRASAQRAELLATVVAAGQGMATADTSTVLATLADAARGLGFATAEVWVHDHDAGVRRAVKRRGVDGLGLPDTLPVDAGLPGAVAAAGDVVVVDDVQRWPLADEPLRGSGLTAVLGCPVWRGDELVALLAVGIRDERTITVYERECVELLARQAGAALALTQQFARQRVLERELLRQAATDPLTGAANRARFLERVDEVLDDDAQPLAVLYLDLDHFKAVNDQLGHLAGDELLRIVAQRIQRCVRPQDFVGRLGGDEFSVLLEGVRGPDAALAVADRILVALDQPVALTAGLAEVGVSIGIAFHAPGEPTDRQALLSDADAAMYTAKGDPEARVRLGASCRVHLGATEAGRAVPRSESRGPQGSSAR